MFKVGYNNAYSEDKAVITVTDMPLPKAADDPQPESTSFVHRTFFNQYTAAGCQFCPGLTKLLRETLVGDVKDQVVLAAIRVNYGEELTFAALPVPSGGQPYLDIDFKDTYQYNKSKEGLVEKINAITSNSAKVGISANPVYDAEKKKIVVRVAVKAAESGEYNVGLWLMQDNYYKVQTDGLGIIGSDKSYNYHHNGVRIAESLYAGSYTVGMPLGNLAEGETCERVFIFDIKDGIEKKKGKGGWWDSFTPEKLNDLHFAAFVTAPYTTSRGSRSYEVVNAIDFPYNTPAPFDYK